MRLDPQQHYLSLLPAGQSQLLPGGEAFWQQPPPVLDALGRNWLVTESSFNTDLAQWELHPAGDELVYLLTGAAELWLELPEGWTMSAAAGACCAHPRQLLASRQHPAAVSDVVYYLWRRHSA